MKNKKKSLISLEKFIENSLYEKNTGYYMSKNPFGNKGDFITSPNISIFFYRNDCCMDNKFMEKF